MAIQFEFYKNPGQEEDEKTSFHPRVVNFQHVTTRQLAAEIHSATTFGCSEVEAMLMELSRCMGNHLREGKRVHLDGVGYFQITLKANGPIHTTTARADKVALKCVGFQADKDLKGALVGLRVQRSKLRPHSSSLTNEQIDRKLTAYFATHPVLTRTGMQSLCGFTQSTAGRHIRRLRTEGCLQNIGRPTQPIYIPMPRYYGK